VRAHTTSVTDEYEGSLGFHAGAVIGIAINSDGTHVVSVGDDRVVRTWNSTTGASLGTVPGGVPGAV
jgi:WD40 repeat protein